MLYIKSLILCAFLAICIVKAETVAKDGLQEPPVAAAATNTAPLPVVLQLSEALQSNDNENRQPEVEKNTNTNFNRNPNDIEVFKETMGPQKEKQEEEPAAEAEEPKEEEAEAEPTAEAEAEAAPEAEAEPAAVDQPPEEPKEEEKEEVPAEPEAEKQPETETDPAVEGDKENAEPNKETDESEMPKDEPAKEQEENYKSDVSNTSHVAKDILDKKELTCFTCTNTEDSHCSISPTKETKCPKQNEGDKGRHNGCFTLYQVDTNTTMRGCVDELAEDGLKYCLTHDNLCNLCYTSNCNSKAAPSSAAKLLFNNFSFLFLTISFITIKQFSKKSFTHFYK